MEKRLHATVSGRVQGVFFRAFAKSKAIEFGVRGFVRNLPNDGVEIVAEGEEKQLESFLSEIKKGPPAAKIDRVRINWEKAKGEFKEFGVRY